ncbi:DUF5988 family protein [Streptomyces sp. H27-D2]|uniref:DUF5988 family protein n=1 Tax=Streptomyces sp. H27-D2 TaxID=3046304 RepID=UPI002DB75D5D|nr:DUF5988 family protein [Streptomyces sp. H27-D2]MEC4017089.1 DUF5988 family protein [Streptomyces sp. H27-D2]
MADAMHVFLEGGPPELLTDDRLLHVEQVDEDIVVPRYGGCEHFTPTRRTCEVEGQPCVVFQWNGQTKVAE